MATNWIVLTSARLLTVMHSLVTGAADVSITTPSAEKRSDDAIQMVTDRIRWAISSGGRTPLSLTVNSIPPEAVQHGLNIAAFQLISATPSLCAVIFPPEAYSPFKELVKTAEAWIKSVSEGDVQATLPTDPTLDANGNPTPNGVNWGDQYGTQKDYAAGTVTPAPYDFTTSS